MIIIIYNILIYHDGYIITYTSRCLYNNYTYIVVDRWYTTCAVATSGWYRISRVRRASRNQNSQKPLKYYTYYYYYNYFYHNRRRWYYKLYCRRSSTQQSRRKYERHTCDYYYFYNKYTNAMWDVTIVFEKKKSISPHPL